MRLLLVGKAKYVFQMINLLACSGEIEQDKDWWAVRAWIIANDRDLKGHELSQEARLAMRLN